MCGVCLQHAHVHGFDSGTSPDPESGDPQGRRIWFAVCLYMLSRCIFFFLLGCAQSFSLSQLWVLPLAERLKSRFSWPEFLLRLCAWRPGVSWKGKKKKIQGLGCNLGCVTLAPPLLWYQHAINIWFWKLVFFCVCGFFCVILWSLRACILEGLDNALPPVSSTRSACWLREVPKLWGRFAVFPRRSVVQERSPSGLAYGHEESDASLRWPC